MQLANPKYKHESNPPGSGLKRPLQTKDIEGPLADEIAKASCKRPSEMPVEDPMAQLLSKTLPKNYKHDKFASLEEVDAMLHAELKKHENYSLP